MKRQQTTNHVMAVMILLKLSGKKQVELFLQPQITSAPRHLNVIKPTWLGMDEKAIKPPTMRHVMIYISPWKKKEELFLCMNPFPPMSVKWHL